MADEDGDDEDFLDDSDTDGDCCTSTTVFTFYGADSDDDTTKHNYPTTDEDVSLTTDMNSDPDLSFDTLASIAVLSHDTLCDLATARVNIEVDVFYDAIEDPPSITLSHGINFFDTVSELPTCPSSWY